MQDRFSLTNDALENVIKTISYPRLSKYRQYGGNDNRRAYHLYRWNTGLSQHLYLPIQAWEIAYRNALAGFLHWKYGRDWPYDARLQRQLGREESAKLATAIGRQRQQRSVQRPETGQIVADLTSGFWVALLSKRYEIPFALRPGGNLGRILPSSGPLSRAHAWERMNNLRDLRNRIAHHEPIFHLDLDKRWRELQEALAWLCTDSAFAVRHACAFEDLWANRPV